MLFVDFITSNLMIRKSAFHFVLIVRAFKDAQWFFGPLGAEEFADNDEKAECRCHSDCTSGGAS